MNQLIGLTTRVIGIFLESNEDLFCHSQKGQTTERISHVIMNSFVMVQFLPYFIPGTVINQEIFEFGYG